MPKIAVIVDLDMCVGWGGERNPGSATAYSLFVARGDYRWGGPLVETASIQIFHSYGEITIVSEGL
jgi:hypothetical protein